MESISSKNFKPNKNRMNNVARSLGVNINEPFKIQFFTHKNSYKHNLYVIKLEGLFYSFNNGKDYNQKSNALEGLLIGKHQIIKIA